MHRLNRASFCRMFFLLLGSARAIAGNEPPNPDFRTWNERLHGQACRIFIDRDSKLALPADPLEQRPLPVVDLGRKPEFLRTEELATDGPLWRRWMTRAVDAKTGAYYLINARTAIEYFDEWFRAEDYADFRGMFDRFHFLSAVGANGGRIYHTLQSNTAYTSGDFFPGFNRASADELGHLGMASALVSREHPSFRTHRFDESGSWLALAVNLLETPLKFRLPIPWDMAPIHRVVEPFEKKVPGPVGRVSQLRFDNPSARVAIAVPRKDRFYYVTVYVGPGAGANHYPSVGWTVRLDGFVDSHSRNRYQNSLLHSAPPAREVAEYFRIGSEHFRRLAALIRQGPPSRVDILETLADYYQVLLNGHPYFRINNSVLMNQVNYFLRLCGYRAVPHEDLDYWANALDTAEFRRLFRDHVGDYQ